MLRRVLLLLTSVACAVCHAQYFEDPFMSGGSKSVLIYVTDFTRGYDIEQGSTVLPSRMIISYDTSIYKKGITSFKFNNAAIKQTLKGNFTIRLMPHQLVIRQSTSEGKIYVTSLQGFTEESYANPFGPKPAKKDLINAYLMSIDKASFFGGLKKWLDCPPGSCSFTLAAQNSTKPMSKAAP